MGHNRIILGLVFADSPFRASGIGNGPQEAKVEMSLLFKCYIGF